VTYYLTANPSLAMQEFVAFVRKNYSSSSQPTTTTTSSNGVVVVGNLPISIPFSHIQVCPEAMTLCVDDLVPERYLYFPPPH
jgi:hypothetical protein